ncbi:Type cbb3 cytochrome oxidase biogenesis protein CcoS, involved in heme b insertion [hydrothermal vent metagenome]|uniref:Type cbb3 cytochrome oxidase biogenesis protein CcoS, involved in heme b insertion n=1 Tax=hydrothermal vent metagenome TaxID=652676 RepID=A0A3B0WC27_9ZZZZ
MDVIYGLIPMMLVFGFLVVVVFIWMAKTGHFDDLDGAANRIFMDDEYPEDLPEDLNKESEKLKEPPEERN